MKLKPLTSTSTFGVIAPASCESNSIIDSKLFEFEKLGFNIKKGAHIYDKFGYLAGNDKDRANDLMDMFLDDDIDAVICLRGGYGCMRLIPYLDFSLIRKHPKIFCGYSDITVLLNLINQKCGFPTFHGPMVNSDFNNSITLNYFMDILTNYHNPISYNLESLNNSMHIFNPKNFTGTLVGGNLSVICSTLGTPYEINFKDSILLIEEINESPYVIDRLLTQLISSKKLRHCQAIILGNFTNCNTSNNSPGFDIDELLHQKLIPLRIPIINGFPIGHSYPNITIPIGIKFKYYSATNVLFSNKNIFI